MRTAWIWGLLALLLAACGAGAESVSGPRLVAERTLEPTQPLPTRLVTETPTRGVTPEIASPLEQVTVDAQFIVITPTLPPSKTPTQTQTPTLTPTITLTPTTTVTATATGFLLPTSEIIAVTEPAAVSNDVVCESNWVDIQPRPDKCPMAPPNASPGTFQQFENGYMVHVAAQDAIYVLYNDTVSPRWQVYRDNFSDANPSMARLDEEASERAPGRWNPRRGFGLLWETEPSVQSRLGLATEKWEQRFSVQVQTTRDGTIFVAGRLIEIGLGDGTPQTFGFGLFKGGSGWNTYSYNGGGGLVNEGGNGNGLGDIREIPGN